jgi:hypothetical protein
LPIRRSECDSRQSQIFEYGGSLTAKATVSKTVR